MTKTEKADRAEPQRRKGPARREAFMNAALTRFARQGFAATSTRQICTDLDIAHSAIYNYFPTKESILLAIGEREMTVMQAELDAVVSLAADRSARDRLQQAVHKVVLQAMDRREAWRLLVDMLPALAPRNRAIMIDHRDRFEATIRDLLRQAVEAGEVEAGNQDLTIFNLLGMADGIARWYRPNGPMSKETIADNTTAFFMRALRTAE